MSDQRLLPWSWGCLKWETWMVGGGGVGFGEEERLATEVSQRKVTSMTSAVISSILSLDPWNTIGSTWVPSTRGRGWPAMHDNYPYRNSVPLPSAAYPDKQKRAQEVCLPATVIWLFNLVLLLWVSPDNWEHWLSMRIYEMQWRS